MPTTLAAGDIAIIGVNADDPDSFGFVVLTDIEAGTVITFTDNGWAGTGFRTGEGSLTYTFPANVPAGTVVNLGIGSMSLSTGGDSIIAYQGPASAPVVLFAIDLADGNSTFAASATNSNTSGVPTGLVLGQTAVAVPQDNVVYNGPTSGSRAELLAAISNPANWVGSDTARQEPITQAFTVGSNSTFSISDATVTEGDAGTTTMTFTVSRSVGTGTASVNYATTDGSATSGSDYAAGVGTVTFAEGETSKTITIVVNGDDEIEGDEAFVVTLSNPVGGAITDGQGIGTIKNDDVAPRPAPPFINEFHYDNGGTDAGEFIEIAGAAGLDLTGYTLVLYNGNDGSTYGPPRQLSGVIPNLQNGLGVLQFSVPGLQNGSPDGFALVAPDGTVLEFISYEGSFVARNGPAAGMTSLDVGVEEDGGSNGTSIGRVGTGGVGANFEWALLTDDTPGTINSGQTFTPTVAVSDAEVVEGQSGTTVLRFSVSRSNGEGTASIDYATANGPANGLGANGADYVSAAGTITFADGETTRIIEVVVNGDGLAELNEILTLNLSNPSAGLSIAVGQGVGTIVNDDAVPPIVNIGDVRINEGDNGDTVATFTVTREGGQGAFSVDFTTADGTATAGSDYLAAMGTVTFAAGETSKTISVVIKGDTVAERSETFTVTLSNPTGDAAIVDGSAVGRIVNDDLTQIYAIQGEGHVSAFAGESVLTEGVITAIDNNGFYIQSATGDGNDRTSDAIFVFTNNAPTGVTVGDVVRVRGTVQEFKAAANALSVTRLISGEEGLTYDKIGTGTVQAVVLGTGPGERAMPTNVIDDDGLTSYDPETDGIDFYESLEGMVVTVKSAQAVAYTDDGGTYVVASSGNGATGMNDRGGITVGDGATPDFNPEAIRIYDDATISGSYQPNHTAGDKLGDVTGVITYFDGEFQVAVTEPVVVQEDVTLVGEITDLIQGDTAETGTADQLTVATYNVLNLNPGVGDRIGELANDIVKNLGTPDIIGLVEVQDGNDGTLSGAASAQALIDAIFAQSGVRYQYVEVAPTTPGETGGVAGGNIRNGFLYNPERVDYVEGSAALVPGDAFIGSRRPLSAQFEFNGETVTAVAVHSSSRIGSDPLFGSNQPANNADDAARIAQSLALKAYLDALQAADPDADVVVMGDFNAFQFERALKLLEEGAAGLNNLYELLAPEDRYSYIFGANSQAIDHMLISESLRDAAQFDAVHLNTGLKKADQGSDHDALLAQLFVVGSGNNKVVGTAGADVLRGLAGNDRYTVNHAGDVVIEAANEGIDTVVASLSYTLGANVENLTLIGEALNGTGNDLDNVIIGNAGDNRLVGLAGNDYLDGGLGGDIMTGGTGNDIYVVDDQCDVVVELRGGGVDEIRTTRDAYRLDNNVENLTGLSNTGQVLIGNNVNNIVTGAAGADHIDGWSGDDRLYGMAGDDFLLGGQGHDSLFGGADNDRLEGGSGNDRLEGGEGDDLMRGEAGNDVLLGGDGADRLDGGAGNDTLIGGLGDDILSGGSGNDLFILGPGFGNDVITDFRKGDTLDWSAMTELGITATTTRQGTDTLISFSDGSSVLLQYTSEKDVQQYRGGDAWSQNRMEYGIESDWMMVA